MAGLGLVGAFLLSASPAIAKNCPSHHTPHGNSEASQYAETVPGPCGDQNIGGNGGHGGGSGSANGTNGSSGSASGVPTSSITQLRNMGPAGVQAASIAEATSPLGGGNGKGGSTGSGSSSHGGTGGNASGNGAGSGSTSGTADGTSLGDGSGDGSALAALASLVTGGSDNGVGPILPVLLIGLLLGGLGFLALMRARPQ